MNKTEANRQIIKKYYTSINSGNFDIVMALMHEKVTYNVIGFLPFSGRWEGRDRVYSVLVPAVMASFKEGSVKFAEKWKIMSADEKRVTGLMSGEAITLEGKKFETTYCQIFKIENSIIREVHEFLDTYLNYKTHDPKNLPEEADDYGPMKF